MTASRERCRSRRRAAALAWLALLASSPGAQAAGELTVISFGRADQDALTRVYYTDFSRSTGIRVKSLSYDGQISELEPMVQSGRPQWDVIQVESRALELGCRQGLFERLDMRRIAPPGDFIPGAVSDCGVGIFAWSVALAYSDRLKDAPASWADFWDVKRFPGRRGLRHSAKYTLEIALLADGVAPHEVYPTLATEAGVARAFAKLDRIKDDILWWEAAAQPGVLLAEGDMVMSAGYALWLDPSQPRNEHTRLAWGQSLYDVDSWAVPKGSPRLADAYRFIAFASTPQRQKRLSERLPYGPANRKALALIRTGLAGALPSSQANVAQALKVDASFWIEHGEALEKRFEAWAPPICRQQTDDDEDDYREPPICQDVRGRMQVNSTGPSTEGAGAAN